MRPKSSEICLWRLLGPAGYAAVPLCQLLPDLGIPIAFMYGEYDWMSREPADKLISEKKVEGEVFQTGASGHHLYVEAAVECVSCLVKFAYGEEAQNAFISS